MPKLDFPSMIAFDYGQTLIDERKYDTFAGISALMDAASVNPDGVSAEEVHKLYRGVIKDMGFCGVDGLPRVEVPWPEVRNYIFDYFGIKFDISEDEIEDIFLANALDCAAAPGIVEFIDFLEEKCIRSCVMSNLSYSKRWLAKTLNELIPNNSFENIFMSSDYVFRKPHPRFFALLPRYFGLEPSDIWFCGDSAVCDMEGAYEAGMSPVWYRELIENSPLSRGRTLPPRCDYTPVDNWKELEKIIQRLEDAELYHR